MPSEIFAILKKTYKVSRICKSVIGTFLGKKGYTYCPFLWNDITINPSGDVFICCVHGPVVLGNIYKHNISAIWKNKRIKIARWLSLHGNLHCYKSCFVSNYEEKKRINFPRNVPDYPRRILIEYSTFCNYNCKMCDQDHTSKLALKPDILKKKIDWSKISEITLTGGEVLAIKSAKEFYLWLTKQINKKANIFTNGLLINNEWANYIIDGSNWVYISVNAATEKTYNAICSGNFSKVISNIKNLVSLKENRKSNLKIKFHFTIVPENVHEIPDAIRLADSLGCDIMSFCSDALGAKFLRDHEKIRESLKQRISQIVNDSKIKIEVEKANLIPLGLV